MTNTVKKTRPLAVLAVLMAFFLTSCDAILEGFYPEYKEGGSLSMVSFDFTLNYQTQIDGTIFIKLVPYEFNALAQKDIARPENATGTNFTSTGFYDATENPGYFNTQLTVLPGKKYRLIAYLEDSASPGKPHDDFSNATLVSVNFQDLFSAQDVKDAQQNFGGISGNLQTSSYLPSGVYYELFATSGDVDNAWWLEGPANIDLKDNTSVTSADYRLQRPFSYNLSAVTQIKYTIYGPGGSGVIDNYADTQYANSDQFPLTSGGGSTNLPFDQEGDYNITASYWNEGSDPTLAADGFASLTVHVTDTSGVDTSAEYEGGTFNITVTADGLAGYGYVYYVDSNNYWNYLGYVDSVSNTITSSAYYTPRYMGWQDARIVVDTYDTSWNYTGEFDAPNLTMTGSYTESQTENITVFIGSQVQELADGSLFTLDVNLDSSIYQQFSDYGITDMEFYIYDPTYGYVYYGPDTMYPAGSVYTFSGLGSYQSFTYHVGNPLTIYVYGNSFGYYLGSITLPPMTSGTTSFTITGDSTNPIIY